MEVAIRKLDVVGGKSECGLRPVGAIGAYAPEGRRKRKQSVKLVVDNVDWLIKITQPAQYTHST